MPPPIAVRRFTGLSTYNPKDDGEFTQLIRAENVQFNSAGIIEGRRGFHWRASSPEAAPGANGWYIGTYVDENMFPFNFFQIDGSYHMWSDPGGDVIADIGEGSSFTTENIGVQYGGYMFFSDGNKFEGGNVTPTAGYPGTYGPMESHNERVWCNNNCRLYFSAVGNGDSWPAANFIDVDPVESDTITELKSFRNRLMIFRTKDVWVLETPGLPTSWSLRRLIDDGCDFQSAVEYDGDLYWFGRKGAYRYNGVSIDVISSPVQDVWDNQPPYGTGRSRPRLSYTAAFDDMWFVCLGLASNRQRLLCFHTKLEQWTEWILGWTVGDSSPPLIRGMWSEQANTQWVPRGLYLFIEDSPNFFIAAILPEDDTGVTPYSYDTTGEAVYVDDVLQEENAYPFNPVIQTKFSDFGEPFDMKRVTNWMLEYTGTGLEVEQIDEEDRTVEVTVDDNGGSTTDVYQRRIKGIGYFRKLSMKITLQLPTSAGWYIHSVYGKMVARGPKIKNANETTDA